MPPTYSLPKAVIYVAETSCCGLKIHDPRHPGKPAHANRGGEGPPYPECKILRYWEYGAKRQVARAEILKT